MVSILVTILVVALVAVFAFPMVSAIMDWQKSGMSIQDWLSYRQAEEQRGRQRRERDRQRRERDLIDRNAAPLYRKGDPGTVGGGSVVGGYRTGTGFEQINAGVERSSRVKMLNRQVQVADYLGGAGRIAGTYASLAMGQSGVYGGTVSSLGKGKLQ